MSADHWWLCPRCGEATDEPAFTLAPFDLGVYCPNCEAKVELDVNPEAFPPAERRSEGQP